MSDGSWKPLEYYYSEEWPLQYISRSKLLEDTALF